MWRGALSRGGKRGFAVDARETTLVEKLGCPRCLHPQRLAGALGDPAPGPLSAAGEPAAALVDWTEGRQIRWWPGMIAVAEVASV